MIENLLLKQLEQELIVAAQMSYFAGAVKDLTLRELCLQFAKEELEHFSVVVNILSDMGYKTNIEPFTLNFETDLLKALIILEAIEDTMIHYYKDILPELRQPFKDKIKDQINMERDHKKKIRLLLEEAKKDMKAPSNPGQEF